MITFETQEDFEEAVLNLIKKRLRVDIGRDCGEHTIDLSIMDWHYDDEDTPQDTGFSSACLPTPSLRY